MLRDCGTTLGAARPGTWFPPSGDVPPRTMVLTKSVDQVPLERAVRVALGKKQPASSSSTTPHAAAPIPAASEEGTR
jgi:hypothetical protein